MRLSHSSQIIVVAVLALHIVVIAAMGSAPLGITFSNALQFAACLAAVAGCAGAAARQTGYFRRFWILQSCGLACWAAGEASFIYYTNLRHTAIPATSATDFLYLAAYLPLAATVLMSHKDNTRLDWLEILDIIQVAIVVSSLYLYLLVVLGKLSADRSSIWNKELVYWYFDANLALLSGYLFRVISAQGDVRRLFGWISVSLVTFLAADTAYAYGVTRLHLSGGTWLDLGYTCSFAATIFIAAHWRRTGQTAADSSVPPEWVRRLTSLLPTLAPMLVLLLAIPVASRRPAIAWTVLACSMVCLGLRLAMTQYQQQRASEKLECSERHFRALLEKSSDAIALLDRQGKILYLSPSFEHLLGYVPQERVGFDSVGRVHPDDQNRLAADMAKLYATPGGSSRGEYRSQHKDGRWIWIEGVATNLIDDPNVAAVVVNFRDITERKRAAERFAKAFRAHPTPMSIARLADAKALDVNEAWLRLGGFSREEVVGQNARQLNVWVDPEEREALMRRLRSEGKVQEVEIAFRRKNGELLTLLVSGEIIELDGEACVLWGGQDITELKRSQEQLRQAQKMEAVGRLAGGIAHDFNNLLAVILGNTEMLEERFRRDAAALARLHAVRKAGESAASLTRQLLAFCRKQILEPKLLNLNQSLGDLQQMFSRLLGEDVKVTVDLDPSLRLVKADPGQVEQLILNLVVNARDAMPSGGHLTLKTANVLLDDGYVVRHRGSRPGEFVMLSVSDTGSGMDEATIARIFEPFFTTKSTGKGTGLGLATVYGVVKQNEGYIEVESQLGSGSTFRTYLPVAAATTEDARPKTDGTSDKKGEGTILVVEDDEAVREVTCTMLQGCGYSVLTAQNLGEVETQCDRHRDEIDLLLTDVILPGLTGKDAAEVATRFCPTIKVLYMSGYTDDRITSHGILHAGVHFLQKPFSRHSLATKIKDVLAT